MDEDQRLSLIAESIRYCQRVRDMGMPASCYSKALREPVHFLWELYRHGQKVRKERAAHYCSTAAVGLRQGNRQIVYDHAIPFRILQAHLLDLAPVTLETVRAVLERYCVACIVTTDENRRLTAAGLHDKMPPDWDGRDPLACFAAAGIEVTVNPFRSQPALPRNRAAGPTCGDQIEQVTGTKQVTTNRDNLYRGFWARLLAVANSRTSLHHGISPRRNNYLSKGAGSTGLVWFYKLMKNDARVGFLIYKDTAEANDAIYQALEAHRTKIDTAFGEPLDWIAAATTRGNRIECRLTIGGFHDEDRWPEVIDEMVDAMVRLEATLSPAIQKLDQAGILSR